MPTKVSVLVAFSHNPEDCPLREMRPGPDAALRLADLLDELKPVGVMSPKAHHGVILLYLDEPLNLPEIEQQFEEKFARASVRHRIKAVRARLDSAGLARLNANPSLLDGDEETSRNGVERRTLLNLIGRYLPDWGFDQTAREDLPTKSLGEMPRYLRQAIKA
jgi:hypothetical protein